MNTSCVKAHCTNGGSVGRVRVNDELDDYLRSLSLFGITAIWTLCRHTHFVTSVAFSPDGRRVLTGSSYEAKLWDVGTGEEIRTLSGHTVHLGDVAFSPDGTRVVTAGRLYNTNTAKLWDAETGEMIRTFRHTTWVRSVEFSPDGRFVLTGSLDGTARIWDISDPAARSGIADEEWALY